MSKFCGDYIYIWQNMGGADCRDNFPFIYQKVGVGIGSVWFRDKLLVSVQFGS